MDGVYFYSNLSYDPLFSFFFFLNYFWNLLKKRGRVYFFSFWSYEPPFRQEGGEGEAVTDGWTDGQMDGQNFHSKAQTNSIGLSENLIFGMGGTLT